MEGNTAKSSTCPHFEDLSCFIDEELESARLASVSEHVASCDRCSSLTSQLRQSFDSMHGVADGGVSGTRCADEEGLVLYLMRGLSEPEKCAVEAHLSRCDACVYSVALLRRRLRIDASVDQAVPTALRQKVREIIEAGTRDLAEESQSRQEGAPSWVHRVRDSVDRFLRLPILVPTAIAAGALMVIGVQSQNGGAGSSGGSGMRAVEQVSTMRVTAGRAVVREIPRGNGLIVAELRSGDRVQVAGTERDWYRVILSDDRGGWVEREAFE